MGLWGWCDLALEEVGLHHALAFDLEFSASLQREFILQLLGDRRADVDRARDTVRF